MKGAVGDCGDSQNRKKNRKESVHKGNKKERSISWELGQGLNPGRVIRETDNEGKG